MHDNNGNLLFKQGNVIKLQLASEPHPRKIGILNEALNILQVIREPNKHLFRKNNSYGFNETILRTATKFTHIELLEKNGTILLAKYLIPIKIILEQGTYLNFKGQGFEVQIFLRIETIKQYKYE
jgi:hypothetical protein